ncbi:unnamed protein product [Penicillium egyptiacum]|uniref:Uncharacterized protein n=1 Tax=Penicillium egyptiacum TaxID=1303716 RepID=A0A9W4K212_9EURO|nr:unnamed protein product [Penicillium egyptiacum]
MQLSAHVTLAPGDSVTTPISSSPISPPILLNSFFNSPDPLSMADSIRSGLSNIHSALDNLVKNPGRLDIDRSRFDRDASYISHQSHNSTASMSPNGPSDRQSRRDLRKWQLSKDHEASRPDQQFDVQVNEMEACIIEGIENRTLDVPDGTIMRILARDTVRENWMKQGIWNKEWGKTPQMRWMHEASPEITPAPEIDTGAFSHLRDGLFSSFGSALPTGKKIQEGGERRAKQKTGDGASRPFQQFIYQISKERERVQNDSDSPGGTAPVPTSTDINTKAYETVKAIWVKRGIWNEEWGILPGMAWKHEGPLWIPDNDCDSIPSPIKPREHVTFNMEDKIALLQEPLFHEPLSTQADGPAPNGGHGTSKRKRATAPVETKRPRRKVFKTTKPETSNSRRAVHNSTNQVDVPDQGTQGTGRRRSKRLQNQTKGFK